MHWRTWLAADRITAGYIGKAAKRIKVEISIAWSVLIFELSSEFRAGRKSEEGGEDKLHFASWVFLIRPRTFENYAIEPALVGEMQSKRCGRPKRPVGGREGLLKIQW